MSTVTELMQWTTGQQSYTELARMANWPLQPMDTAGLTEPAVALLWKQGKHDVETATKAVVGCRNPKTLARMLKDPRMSVKTAVLNNPHVELEDIVAFLKNFKNARSANWKIRDAAEKALRVRVANTPIDEAISLMETLAYVPYIEDVARHRHMTEEHLVALAGATFEGMMRYGGSGTAKMNGLLAARQDLWRFSDSALITLADNGAWSTVAAIGIRHDRQALVEHVLAAAIADSDLVGTDALITLSTAELEERHYTWLLSMPNHRVVRGVAANTNCPWSLLGHLNADSYSIPALGRALAALFEDDPGVWMLVAKTASEGRYTISELVEVATATFPQSLRPAAEA